MEKGYLSKTHDYPFLKGGGEMGEMIRSYDWSHSSIGTIDQWPQSLKTTLGIILHTAFPQFLFWGPELTCFYNDAFRPSLGANGKHPALGKNGKEVWPEIWDFIGPLIQKVMETGEAVWFEDQLVPFYRNGQIEDIYWTFSYSPAYGDDGQINGVYVTCTETTDKIRSLKALEEKNRQLAITIKAEAIARKKIRDNERNLRLIILQAPVAIAIFRGPEYVVETVNTHALELWGRSYADVLNKPILEAMPELKDQGIKQLLDNVYQTGETFSATELPVQLFRKGQMDTAYINFVYEPIYDENRKINALITIGFEVTEQVLANKELQGINEEMALANEELAAANEELVATNEELAETQKTLHELLVKLSGSEEKLLQAIDTGGMGTWSIDPATLQVNMSAFTRELFGFSAGGGIKTEEIMAAVHPDYHEPLTNILKNAIKNLQSSDIEYPINHLKSGERKWVRATGKVFFDANGNASEYSGLLMDITERKLDELRKNDFIGMVSHELKTPLTTLSAIVQVLRLKLKNNPDSFIAGAMDKANVQVKKMTNMINGFLNISRLESGKIIIVKESFNIDELIAEMVAETMLTVYTHEIVFTDGQTILVNADRDKIGSVISNLLSNAVKYSPKGKNIAVHCEKVDGYVQVSVKDEGMGIKPQDLEKLFDRYYRVETRHTAHISGFGIGLYLSAEIIHRHDGKIWAESESGVGSTFYFTLPL